jgi:hypothetical protein
MKTELEITITLDNEEKIKLSDKEAFELYLKLKEIYDRKNWLYPCYPNYPYVTTPYTIPIPPYIITCSGTKV